MVLADETPCVCCHSVQGREQCGAQVCAQTHGARAGGEDHRDHSGEDDRPAVGGGENLHPEGDPSPQHGEGTFLNQYVGILLFWTHKDSVIVSSGGRSINETVLCVFDPL